MMIKKEITDILKILIPIVFTAIGSYLPRIKHMIFANSLNIREHRVFTVFSDYRWKIDMIIIKENRIVFRDAFKIMLRVWEDQLNSFSRKLIKELKNKNRNTLSFEFEKFLKETENIIFSECEKAKIPKKALIKLDEFMLPRTKQLMYDITISVLNKYYEKNVSVLHIFDLFTLFLAETYSDFSIIVFTKERYNGFFKGIDYNGIPINDEEYDIYYAIKVGKDSYNNK